MGIVATPLGRRRTVDSDLPTRPLNDPLPDGSWSNTVSAQDIERLQKRLKCNGLGSVPFMLYNSSIHVSQKAYFDLMVELLANYEDRGRALQNCVAKLRNGTSAESTSKSERANPSRPRS